MTGDCIDLRADLDAGALDKNGEPFTNRATSSNGAGESPNSAEEYGAYKKAPREKVEYALALFRRPNNTP